MYTYSLKIAHNLEMCTIGQLQIHIPGLPLCVYSYKHL